MNLFQIFIIAVILAMDAFSVSIAIGISFKKKCFCSLIIAPVLFGVFQGVMPIIGWLGGFYFEKLICSFDHWIAFFLLLFVGGKMIIESFENIKIKKEKILSVFLLLSLAIATSIDALAVGLSFAFLNVSVFYPALIIGIVTLLISLIGLFIGKLIGHFFEKQIQFVAGLLLIGIGLKVLLEHILS
ncbi:manganese efflux pump [Candidatus Peregrinibacteria bacterium]|nr:manganese efflux pump [Candidatus Peregrinibacteria bacterium]